MTRRRHLVSLVIAGLAVGCATTGTAARPDGPQVVVTDVDGERIAASRLGPDGRFALTFRHSVYGSRAREVFVADADGGFRLVTIASPSEAVLDYYAVAGERSRDRDGWWHLDLAAPARFDALPLIASETGRRTLEVAQRRVALFAGAGPRHLRVTVVPAP